MKKKPKYRRYPGVFDEPSPIVCPECGGKITAIRTTNLTEKAKMRTRVCKPCMLAVDFMETITPAS